MTQWNRIHGDENSYFWILNIFGESTLGRCHHKLSDPEGLLLKTIDPALKAPHPFVRA